MNMNMSIRSISLASVLLMFPLSTYAASIEITEIPVLEIAPVSKTESYTRLFKPFDAEFPRIYTTVRIDSSSLVQPTDLKTTGFDTFYDVLPFEWQVIADKPLLHVLPEFTDYSSTQEIKFLDLLRIFNVEVIVPPTLEFEYPNEATLVFDIRSSEYAIQVELPMRLDSIESSYFILDPNQLARELILKLDRFQASDDQTDLQKPSIYVRELKGFDLANRVDESENRSSIPVAYKLRFGSFSVDSGFQNVGSTDSVEFRIPIKPRLTQHITDSYGGCIL